MSDGMVSTRDDEVTARLQHTLPLLERPAHARSAGCRRAPVMMYRKYLLQASLPAKALSIDTASPEVAIEAKSRRTARASTFQMLVGIVL